MIIVTDSPSASPTQPPRAKSYRWLWIMILSVLCICLIGAVVIANKFLNQKGPLIDITTGKLNGTIYTNSDESFTCDFEKYITQDIWLRDPIENGVGKVDLYNSVTSVNITIQYLIPDENIQNLLKNPQSYAEGISTLSQDIGKDFENRFPNSNLLISETQNDDNIFVVYTVPDGRYSYFDNPTSDLDLLLGILLFARSHYVYIIQEGFPLNKDVQALSKDKQINFVRTRIEETSQACAFNR
jgi:flagellar basal body-associated protein FliL